MIVENLKIQRPALALVQGPEMRLEASIGVFVFGVGGALLILCLEIAFASAFGQPGASGVEGVVLGFLAFILLGLGLYLIGEDAFFKKE